MVVTAAEATRPVQGGLRPMDPTRDLRAIADLISGAFADEIDERGAAALRELRLMAYLTPLVWWLSRADPAFRDAFNGFVWEEPSPTSRGRLVVGNVSLSRTPGSRQRRIISNVVVRPEYQGRGIGRELTEAAVAEARDQGAAGVVLQVHKDNPRALQLYTSLGFEEAAGEIEMQLDSLQPVAFLDAPGYHLRPWQATDGQAVYDLARFFIPTVLQWLNPIRTGDYQLDWLSHLGLWFSDLLAGRRNYRLAVLKEERLVATMAVTAAFRRGKHRLALMVHPDHAGRVESTLVSRAIHMLSAVPARPVKAVVQSSHTAAWSVLREYGFKEQRTLLTLSRDF